MAKAKAVVEPIEYVRQQIKKAPRKSWTRIAADNDLTERTISNIMNATHTPRYDTVMRLHDFFKAAEGKGRAA